MSAPHAFEVGPNYGVTVKFALLVPVPPLVVTAMGPVTVPAGTSASS